MPIFDFRSFTNDDRVYEMREMTLARIIKEFERFSNSIKASTVPACDSDIIAFEQNRSVILPIEYKQLLSYSNGIMLMGDEIYGVGKSSLSQSLETTYQIEHYLVDNPMMEFLIPFSPDGFGNHYCFDSRDGAIVFWQHDLPASDNVTNRVYNNLFEMIDEVFFKWTLEHFDYSGNKL